MRSTENKAKLGDCFRKDVQYIDRVDGIPSYIIDGGYLLHKFIWLLIQRIDRYSRVTLNM